MARVIVFDSGMGGLSVYRAINHVMKPLDLFYVADFRGFPYGSWDEIELSNHIMRLIGQLIADLKPDFIVIACNTASTLVLEDLRMAYPSIQFVGTVPAIKPAANATQSGMISVLATPGTAKRAYTKNLIDTYADNCDVTVVATPNLAQIAEDRLQGKPIDVTKILEEIKPAFRQDGEFKTDTIVLGCTHYPLILKDIRAVAPWEVAWIDPAPAISKRLYTLLDGAISGGGAREAYHTNDFNTYGQEKIFHAFGFQWLKPLQGQDDIIEI